MAIKDIFHKYDENSKYLSELNISKKNKIKSFIFGYLIALIIMLSPIIFTAHFFIYSFYYKLVLTVIVIEFISILLLGEIFYHRLLMYFSEDEKKNLILTHVLNGFIYYGLSLICLLLVILIFRK